MGGALASLLQEHVATPCSRAIGGRGSSDSAASHLCPQLRFSLLRFSRRLTSLAPQTRSRMVFPLVTAIDRIFRNEGVTGSNPVSSTKRPGQGYRNFTHLVSPGQSRL